MTEQQTSPGRCLPCTHGIHDWCTRQKQLIGLSQQCGCNHDQQQKDQRQ